MKESRRRLIGERVDKMPVRLLKDADDHALNLMLAGNVRSNAVAEVLLRHSDQRFYSYSYPPFV